MTRTVQIGMLFGGLVAFFGVGGVLAADGDRGRVVGKVVSSETGEPLAFANVALFIADPKSAAAGSPAAGGSTQMDGSYRLDAAPGRYWMTVSYISFNATHVEGVVVTAGGATELHVSLVPEAVKVETIEVTAKAIQNSEAAILSKQKKASAVSDAVSAEAIAKTPDSDAAEVARRITGVTVVNDRYVYVRGLGERYSSTQINGASIGTPEPNKKVVPLDLFGAALLDNITIQKTYTPDKPGEFGGGVVEVSTREFPGQRVWGLSLKSGYNGDVTGEKYLTYSGGDTDYLGIDDGVRDVPSLVEEQAADKPVVPGGVATPGFTKAEIESLGESFSQVWTPQRKSGRAPASFNATYGDELRLFGRPLGFSATSSYSNEFSMKKGERNTYVNGGESGPTPYTLYQQERFAQEVLWGTMGSMSYRISKHNTVDLSAMYNRSAEDEVRFQEGDNPNVGAEDLRLTRLLYVERGLLTGSAGMTHNLPPLLRSTVEWSFDYSKAERNEPDRREYAYQPRQVTEEDSTIVYELALRSGLPGVQRRYGELEDETRSFQADWTIPMKWSGRESKLKTGTYFKGQDRDEGYRRFEFVARSANDFDLTLPIEEILTPENIDVSGWTLKEQTSQFDLYTGSQRLSAQYLMIDAPVSRALRVVTGARLENCKQTVSTVQRFSRGAGGATGQLDDTDVLPSINATYVLSGSTNLRGAFSHTLNRPELREMSVLFYDDDDTDFRVRGNRAVQSALLRNYDLRLEAYPGPNELFAASVFYKHISNPIERVLLPGGLPVIEPRNAEQGKLLGLELEGRIGLSRVSEKLKPLQLSTNWALIQSEAKLGDSPDLRATNNDRPLQGQSPYALNMGLTFAPERARLQTAVLYNVFGKRLNTIGGEGLPDIYEQPRHSLDFTAAYRAGAGVKVKFAMENVLDDEALYKMGDAVTKSDESGRTVSLSLSSGS